MPGQDGQAAAGAEAVAIEADGKIVAAGTSHGTATGDNIALARYTTDGKLDTGFGNAGKVSTDLGTKADHGNAVAVQRDGKILVAGTTADPAQVIGLLRPCVLSLAARPEAFVDTI